LKLFPADRFKLFSGITFFQDKKGASFSRSFLSEKLSIPLQKAFHSHQG